MMSSAIRCLVAISAVVLLGCGSGSGTSGTGGNLAGAPGSGGATVSTGGGSGTGGSIGPGSTGGSAVPAGSGGIPGSGGKADRGGNTGNGGNTASGGLQAGGASGRGGTGGGPLGSGGGAGGRGGTVADAAAPDDVASDAPQCPVCPTIRCAYGSPVDSNGCMVCACNPAPDGGAIDVTSDGSCALPEGCSDARVDTRSGAEAAGSRDLTSPQGEKCGNVICALGEFCCNPLTDTCVPPGWACGF
jgi:hypothetical protein